MKSGDRFAGLRLKPEDERIVQSRLAGQTRERLTARHWRRLRTLILTGKRLSRATQNRNGKAFAAALTKIAKRYPDARRIHLVMDNLSTHTEACVCKSLGNAAGKALWKRFVQHCTPKHASWLNAAEIEASLVSRECLGQRRFEEFGRLRLEVLVSALRGRADTAGRPNSPRTTRCTG
jgi:hypothetical protein